MFRTAIFVAPALLIGLVACSGKNNDDDDSTKLKDSGTATPDSGDNMNGDAGEPADTGTPEDSGVPGPCNPVDGSGCPNAGESCVFQTNTSVGQCRTLPAMNGLEQPCNGAQQDCAAGLACVQLQGEAQATCRQVCETANGNGCDGLTGMFNDYTCTIVFQPGAAYGLCQGQNLCNPAEKAAACPQDMTCSLVSNQGDTGCTPAGTAMLGDVCSATAACAPGGVCLNVGDGMLCYEGCDTQHACTAGTDRCQGLQGIAWGICIAQGTACDPIATPCAAGMTCSLLNGAPECAASGTAAVGQACAPNMQCVDNAVCVFLQGQATPLCYEPCDPAAPACSAGMCGNIGQPFGICVP